jgi:hypothetical protein
MVHVAYKRGAAAMSERIAAHFRLALPTTDKETDDAIDWL